MTELFGAISLLLMVTAAAFGYQGWLANRPDGADRYRARFAATGLAFGGFLGWAAEAEHDHAWWSMAGNLIAAVTFSGSAQHWWREWDRSRQASRESQA